MRRESQNAVQELSGMKYVVARWWEKERRVLDNNASPPSSHSCSEEVTASSLVHLIVNSRIPVIADEKDVALNAITVVFFVIKARIPCDTSCRNCALSS